MLVTREVSERVGLFDDDLFAYAEDTDWSLRARREGLHCLVVPESVVRHAVSGSSGGESSPTSIYYSLRNSLVVAERWAPLGVTRTWLRRLEAVAAYAAQVLLAGRRADGLRAVRAAWRDFRRGRLGPAQRDSRICRMRGLERAVPDEPRARRRATSGATATRARR